MFYYFNMNNYPYISNSSKQAFFWLEMKRKLKLFSINKKKII